MRKIMIGCFGMTFLVLSLVSVSFAQVNPNGFPSGPHYNLNIHGKKADFVCPAQEFDSITGLPVYGNSIFVPEYGEGIQIYMQSGKGSKAAAITELQAIDPCAGFDGDGAVIQLPKNDTGYRVYARALAKPTDEPSMTVIPSLVMVQDESGNDLVYLGLVTSTGFLMPNGTFIRQPGKSKAQDITGMFEWTGVVCYFTAPTGDYTPSQICCTDTSVPLDGIYDACQAPLDDGSCPDGYTLLSTFCQSFADEWVFNIGDFVTYLWTAQNDGLKLLQVRFYPN